MDDDIQALRLSAKVMALECLCLSLYEKHPHREGVRAHFAEMKERIAAKALHDSEMHDMTQQEIDAAFAHILGRLA